MNSTYDYDVIKGVAPDAYGPILAFTDALGNPRSSKFIEVKTWDNPCYVRWSYDGTTFGDDYEKDPDDQPLLIPHSAKAFEIMNVTATVIARYQVTAWW